MMLHISDGILSTTLLAIVLRGTVSNFASWTVKSYLTSILAKVGMIVANKTKRCASKVT